MKKLGKSRLPWKIPEFFKVLIEDFKERLYLPPAFVRYVISEVLPCAVLRTYDEKAWSVQLLRRDDDVIFGAGWKEFVEYYKLQIGEFLVFRYCADLEFIVKIFSISGLERPCEAFVETSTVTNQELKGCSARSLFSSKKRSSSCDVESSSSYEKQKTDDDDDDDGDDLNKSDACKPISPVDSSKSRNPSFKVVLKNRNRKKKNTNELQTVHIPNSLYNTHLKNGKNRKYMYLCCANDLGVETMWNVKLYWKYDRGCDITTGFTVFCRENNLEAGDECIFELDSKRSAFRVYINKAKTLA